MDTAKGIGVVAAHDGSILDYEWGHSPLTSRIPPMIAVPTTAGTGSEVTLWAVITDPKRKIKFNVGGTPNIASWVALIDPELSVRLPAPVTAGTGMDALAHAVECFTMVYYQPFTDAVALMAMSAAGVPGSFAAAVGGVLGGGLGLARLSLGLYAPLYHSLPPKIPGHTFMGVCVSGTSELRCIANGEL